MIQISEQVLKELVARLKVTEKELRNTLPRSAVPKNNFTSSSAPDDTNNTTQGYTRGSQYIHSVGTDGTAFICVYSDASTANWQQIT